ncbi:MAG: hypothetical protein PHP01_06580, partial [Phycisphaerae bacterium]|nr:hypothetical protein [Phycisphaerae bacterium]
MKKLTAVIVVVLAVSFAFAANDKTGSADVNGAAKKFAGQKIVISGAGNSQELLRIIAGVVEKKTGGKIIISESI